MPKSKPAAEGPPPLGGVLTPEQLQQRNLVGPLRDRAKKSGEPLDPSTLLSSFSELLTPTQKLQGFVDSVEAIMLAQRLGDSGATKAQIRTVLLRYGLDPAMKDLAGVIFNDA